MKNKRSCTSLPRGRGLREDGGGVFLSPFTIHQSSLPETRFSLLINALILLSEVRIIILRPLGLSLCKMQRNTEKSSGMKFEVQSVEESFINKGAIKMEYEIFSIALLNKETGEIGLIPSVELLSKPKHIQLAELESCLRMYEEELGNIENTDQREIIFENGKGSDMNIKSGEVKLAIVAIHKYMRKLIINIHMQGFECNLPL